MKRRRVVHAAAVLALASGVSGASLLPEAAPRAAAAGLTPYDGCRPLVEHYRAELRRTGQPFLYTWNAFLSRGPAPMPAAAPRDGAVRTGLTMEVGAGPTGTNLQESDVDEPDRVKLADGTLLVLGPNGKLTVLSAAPEPAELATVTLPGGGELLVAGRRVLAVTRESAPVSGRRGPMRLIAPSYDHQGQTTLTLLDLSDPRQPRTLESWTVEAGYVSARLSHGRVRLVTVNQPDVERVYPEFPRYTPVDPSLGEQGSAREQERAKVLWESAVKAAEAENLRRIEALTAEQVLPDFTRRDATGRVVERGDLLECGAVNKAPGSTGSATLTVTTFALDGGLDPLHTTGVTTDGQTVYAAADRLVVATQRWRQAELTDDMPAKNGASATPAPEASTLTTELHTFATGERDRTGYVASGSVPGYVLGRWALSFHKGHLRVATTLTPSVTDAGEPAGSSTMTVLAERDGALVPTGQVMGLGPGERIYAVRYFGDIATVVTFRETDPLYVLDLADPTRPRLRGELKIPGFSTYLHPVGDGKLLGVGREADLSGRDAGMQVSLFDLADLSKPRQVSRLHLGDATSAVLDDSRGFNYDPARRLALLPLVNYGGTSGMVVAVRVGTDGTLTEASRISAPGAATLDRVLYDDSSIYAVSGAAVVAADAATFRRTGTLPLR